ncbi:MAG: nucleoside monophosphate kinase [Candidatus Saccharicenans sp.]
MNKIRAILLLGPPGSGKTPLGEYLAGQKFGQSRVFHFDFGQQLRELLKKGAEEGFSQEEIKRIEQAVSRARLFEREDRHLVIKILDHFIKSCQLVQEDWMVLNGLPRHEEQVKWLCPIVDIKLVVSLACPPEVSIKRILSTEVEDRSGRKDDSLEIISARYRIYRERTRPLLDYFADHKTPVVELQVGETTGPADLWHRLMASQSFRKIISN